MNERNRNTLHARGGGRIVEQVGSMGHETYLTFLSRCHTVNWMRFNASLSFNSKIKRWSK